MRKITCLVLFCVAVTAIAAAIAAGAGVPGQNANSSTTATNTNAAKPKPRTRGNRGKATATGTMTDTASNENAVTQRSGRCDPTQQEQTDLSGTYTGKARHGNNPPVDATLTITGNNFTMTSGSDTHSGRLTAITTCGYTAVTMMMGDMSPQPATPNPRPPNPAMSLRAKKVGDSLTLMSVPGEPMSLVFTSGGGATRPRKNRMRRTSPPPPPAATPTP